MGSKLVALLLILVVAAIGVAVALPHLQDERLTSEVSAAAAALKSGILPAQVQFQQGAYCDRDGNGIGTYAVEGISDRDGANRDPYAVLAGDVPIAGHRLNLLAPVYGPRTSSERGCRDHGNPVINGYAFKMPISATPPSLNDDGTAERTWAVICYPARSEGRLCFAINQAGNVYRLPSPGTADGTIIPRPGESISAFGERITAQDVFGASLVGPWPQPPAPYIKGLYGRP